MNQTAVSRSFRILLVSANRCTTPEPVFPLGLVHLNTALREAGYDVSWLDLLFEPDSLDRRLEEIRPNLVGISVRNIDDVLIRKRETFVHHLRAMVGTIHEQIGCPVVLGGSGFSIMPRELLELTGADFGVVGAGETALLSLINALQTGNEYRSIPGLTYRQGRSIEKNDSALTLPDRQAGPSDWPVQIASHYLRTGGVLNVQTQRGCAHRCCYCTYPLIEGVRHRRRSAEVVVAEFKQLQKLGAHYAFVVDSVFNSSEQHLTEICEGLLRSSLKMRWGCFLRPQGLTPAMMQLMARSGLAHIEFGSDSFCDEVLSAYGKDLTFEDIHCSTELARHEDIDFCHFLIAAGPGETLATMERGFENSQRLNGAVIMVVPGMRIYPGTRLFERAVSEGVVQSDANLLEPVYYLAPGLAVDDVINQLKRFAAKSPNWILGDADPAYAKLVARLRQRGVTGPLWSYFSAAQRLWPMEGDRTSSSS